MKKKQKRSQYTEEQLIHRLATLQKQQQYYLSTLSNSLEQIQQEQDLSQVEITDSILRVNGVEYDISSLDAIILNKDQFNTIDNKAAHITQLKHLTCIEFYLIVNNHNKSQAPHFLSTDICSICQFELFEVNTENWSECVECKTEISGLQCDHYYHTECLNMCIKEQHIQCPICSRIFGVKTGDQPDGRMIVQLDRFIHCADYEDCGTIRIYYDMFPGMRNGQYFPATQREAYLPDTIDGRQLMRLLQLAFERKLIFTVGRSVTTGKDNRIVWNGIHHKTNLCGGISHFGYPDPTYFSRVREELASKGIY